MRNDSNYAAVTKRAIKGTDMAKLETEFKAWVENLPAPGSKNSEDASKGEI